MVVIVTRWCPTQRLRATSSHFMNLPAIRNSLARLENARKPSAPGQDMRALSIRLSARQNREGLKLYMGTSQKSSNSQ